MKVLLLSQWYCPEPALKSYFLGRDLVTAGHAVTIITGFPNYPSGQLYPGYRLRWRQWEECDGARILRLPLYPDHSRVKVKRFANYLSFAVSASFLGPILSSRADLMWVYHPPLTVGIPAWWIGLLHRIPFVYEIQDMWPETLAATGMMPSRQVERVVAALARFVYRQAAAIVVSSPGFKRNLIGKGVPADKVHIIPNWADEDTYRPVPRDETLAAEYNMAGRFNVVYGGNMGAAQGLRNVLQAAALLRDLRDVQFVLVGDGVDRAALAEEVAEQKLSNVRFLERQPASTMPYIYALADVLLVHLRCDPLFEITIPSKTLAYMACGRPILGVLAGDAADVIRQARAGLVCVQEDPGALAETVRTLYTMSPAEREAMGQAGRQAFLANYTRQSLMARYEALFSQVVNKNRRKTL